MYSGSYYNYDVRISNPVGIRGETIAVAFLEKKGYRILERNYRKKYGEIDIIALYNDMVVFIEVKARTSTEFGTGFEAISPWKLRSLMRTAQFYKLLHPTLPENLRMDAVWVLLTRNGEVERIEHIENVTE